MGYSSFGAGQFFGLALVRVSVVFGWQSRSGLLLAGGPFSRHSSWRSTLLSWACVFMGVCAFLVPY